MKNTFIYCGLVSLAVALAACSSSRQHVRVAPVGPAPQVAEKVQTPQGWLVVYSALDSGDFTGEDQVIPHHSAYEIFSSDGKRLKYVPNDVLDPDAVRLPPGNYKIVASATDYRAVTVPVVIETGKVTVVHLDGSQPTIERPTPASDLVQLPGGLIVGWRAEQG